MNLRKISIKPFDSRRRTLKFAHHPNRPIPLALYQARGQYKAYWYYKLQASEPIFVSTKGQGKPSRYKHLAAAGTQAHVDGVIMVIRRVQIDELQKSIDTLQDSWSDLYSDISDKSDSH